MAMTFHSDVRFTCIIYQDPRNLTRIHGVDLTNETQDTCPKRSIKKEIYEEVLGISYSTVSQSEKVVAHDLKEPHSGAIKTMSASRKLNTGKKTVLSWMIETGTILQHEKVHAKMTQQY